MSRSRKLIIRASAVVILTLLTIGLVGCAGFIKTYDIDEQNPLYTIHYDDQETINTYKMAYEIAKNSHK
jgi:hypothetical protein